MPLFNENDLTQPSNLSGNHSQMLALIDCTGDICLGDTIQFTEAVFGGSYRKPRYLGDRTITAKVVNDSYGRNNSTPLPLKLSVHTAMTLIASLKN